MVTCTGTEFCKLAITETKDRSREIVEYLEQRVSLDEPLRLHITGCPNACAQYQIAHIGLMGSKTKVDGQVVDAYDMLLGGQVGAEARFNRAVLRKIPAADCKYRLEALLKAFMRQRKPGEPFNVWCARVGDAKLVEILSNGKGKSQENDDVEIPKVPEADGPVY
jgi:sulfite reductase beta subunit-like hemoprotein